MSKYLVPLGLALLAAGGCAVTQPQNTPVWQKQYVDPATGRGFWIYVPSTYRHDVPAPLIVSCHGTPPYDVAEYHIREWKMLGEQNGCIVVCPELIATDGLIGDGPIVGMLNDERYILSLISLLGYRYKIDRANVMDAAGWIEEILSTFDGWLAERQGKWVLGGPAGRLLVPGSTPAPRVRELWGSVMYGYDADWVNGPRGSSRQAVVDGDGTLTLIWVADTANGLRVFASQSVDAGETWSAEPVAVADGAQFIGHEQRWPALCVTPNGDVHCVFFSTDTTYAEPQCWYTRLHDGTWGDLYRVSDMSGMATHEQAEGRCEADSTGAVHIVWTGYISSGTTARSRIFYSRRGDGGSWLAAEEASYVPGPWSYHPAIAIDSEDNPHVAWAAGCQEPASWWWAHDGDWTEDYVPGPSYVITALYLRQRTTTWQSLEKVKEVRVPYVPTLADVRYKAVPITSPSISLTADDEVHIAFSWRPDEVYQTSQIYYLPWFTGGPYYMPIRISAREGMGEWRNREPVLVRNDAGDEFLYWDSAQHRRFTDIWTPDSWLRVRPESGGYVLGWGECRAIIPENILQSRAPKPLGPISPSEDGFTHFVVSDIHGPPDDRNEANVHYSYGKAVEAATPQPAADSILGPEDWIEGGHPVVSSPGRGDGYNRVSVSFSDRVNSYAEGTAEAADDWDIAAVGERRLALAMPMITRKRVAQFIASRTLARCRYPMRQATVGLGPAHFRLMPGDLAQLDDERLSLHEFVGRVNSVREAADGVLRVELVEEALYTVEQVNQSAISDDYPQPSMVPARGQGTETT